MATTLYPSTASQPDGTAATTTNLGASQATANATLNIWSSAFAGFGRNGIRMETSAAQATNVNRWNLPSSNKIGAFTWNGLGTPTTVTSGQMTLCGIRYNGGRIFNLQWRADGALLFRPTTGTTLVLANPGVITAGTRITVATTWEVGTTTTNGKFSADVYAFGGSTVLATLTVTNVDMGTADAYEHEMGGTGSAGIYGVTGITLSEAEMGRTTKIAAYSLPNTAPTVSLPSAQNVSAASAISMAVTASDVEGSVTTYATTVTRYTPTAAPASVTVTDAATALPKWTAGAAGSLDIVTTTVTDDGGLSTVATTEYRVDAAAGAAVGPLWKNREGATGTWTRVGSAATDGAALADALDTTYLELATLTGSDQWIEVRATPRGTLASGKMEPVRLGTDSGTATAIVRLVEGSTVRETFNQAINATPTDYSFTLATGTISAIADPRNLRWRIGGTL